MPSFLFQKNLNGHKVVVNSFHRNINVLYLYSLDKRYNSLKINPNAKKVLFVCLFLESYSQNVLLVPWRICIIGTGEETRTKICPQRFLLPITYDIDERLKNKKKLLTQTKIFKDIGVLPF